MCSAAAWQPDAAVTVVSPPAPGYKANLTNLVNISLGLAAKVSSAARDHNTARRLELAGGKPLELLLCCGAAATGGSGVRVKQTDGSRLVLLTPHRGSVGPNNSKYTAM